MELVAKISEKTTINEVGDESDHETATTTKTGAAGNNKRPADETSQGDKGEKKKRIKKNNVGDNYRINSRTKKETNIFMEIVCNQNIQSMIILIYTIQLD
jgi:hypothetical protein